MCFSMEASFAAAGVLSTIGFFTVKQVTVKRYYLLALVPLFFGIQQFSEGLIWTHYVYHPLSKDAFEMAMGVFLMFAMFIWPIWIPLSLYIAESHPLRKKLILADFCAGVILASLNLYYAVGQDISVRVVNHSIQYIGSIPSQALIYPLIILLPCFLSSLKRIWMYALLVAITYAFAYSYYTTTFVSVWCFFSAVASVAIYKVIEANQVENQNNEVKT